jgi:hypothetical protein
MISVSISCMIFVVLFSFICFYFLMFTFLILCRNSNRLQSLNTFRKNNAYSCMSNFK